MTMDYGNAAARHMKGVEAEKIIKEARREIANSLKVQEKKSCSHQEGQNRTTWR